MPLGPGAAAARPGVLLLRASFHPARCWGPADDASDPSLGRLSAHNFRPAAADVKLLVLAPPPRLALVWAPPAPVVYGEALGDGVFDATTVPAAAGCLTYFVRDGAAWRLLRTVDVELGAGAGAGDGAGDGVGEDAGAAVVVRRVRPPSADTWQGLLAATGTAAHPHAHVLKARFLPLDTTLLDADAPLLDTDTDTDVNGGGGESAPRGTLEVTAELAVAPRPTHLMWPRPPALAVGDRLSSSTHLTARVVAASAVGAGAGEGSGGAERGLGGGLYVQYYYRVARGGADGDDDDDGDGGGDGDEGGGEWPCPAGTVVGAGPGGRGGVLHLRAVFDPQVRHRTGPYLTPYLTPYPTLSDPLSDPLSNPI